MTRCLLMGDPPQLLTELAQFSKLLERPHRDPVIHWISLTARIDNPALSGGLESPESKPERRVLHESATTS